MKRFVFAEEQQSFRVSEAYKTLRTNLMFCGENIHVIAVTSCIPDAEKTEIMCNMAVNLAETGKRVLLIDADLRRSTMMEKVVSADEAPGLSHLLSGQAELDEVVLESESKNLCAIFSGSFPPNPAELLSGLRFKALVGTMRERFDYILIDTPPLGSVIDGAVVAGVCDGAVVVIRAGKVSHKFAQEVKDQLKKANCRVLGVVLNGVDAEKKGGYYHKYFGSYYGSPRFAARREAK